MTQHQSDPQGDNASGHLLRAGHLSARNRRNKGQQVPALSVAIQMY